MFKRDPHADDLWVFRERRGDLITLIWHDGDGVVMISAARLSYLLSGIDWQVPEKT